MDDRGYDRPATRAARGREATGAQAYIGHEAVWLVGFAFDDERVSSPAQPSDREGMRGGRAFSAPH